jgi:hypothetical protein
MPRKMRSLQQRERFDVCVSKEKKSSFFKAPVAVAAEENVVEEVHHAFLDGVVMDQVRKSRTKSFTINLKQNQRWVVPGNKSLLYLDLSGGHSDFLVNELIH